MYTLISLRSAVPIVITPAKGAKNLNLPMPPKTHLAPRRYSAKSLVQDSLAGRGWLYLLRQSGLGPALPVPCGSVAEVLRVSALRPPGEVAPDLLLSSEAGVRFTPAACIVNIHLCFGNANDYFRIFSTLLCG